MAELIPGVIGTVSGKMGTVIASNWRDIHYLKGLHRTKKTKKDVQSDINRVRFVKIQDFLATVSPLAEEGFKHQHTGRASVLNLAVSANMGAFKEDGADIDYASIRLSAGSLIGAIAPEVFFEPPDHVAVRWADLGDTCNQAPSDRASILFYNSDKDEAVNSIDLVCRGDLQARIPLPGSFAGDELHGYIYFTNAVGTKNSKSVYLGCFNVPQSEVNNLYTKK